MSGCVPTQHSPFGRAYIRRVTESGFSYDRLPDIECLQMTPIMRTQYRPYALSAHMPYRMTEPAYTPTPGARPPPPRRPLRTPLFRPSPSESYPPSQRYGNWAPYQLYVISVTSSPDSPPLPPRRNARRSKIQTTHFMAHVVAPSLPPTAHKSDYPPVSNAPPRTRGRPTAKGKAETIPARMR